MATAAIKTKARLKPLPDFLKLTRSRDLQNVLASSNPPVSPRVYETQFPARLLRFFAKYPPPPSVIAARFGQPVPGPIAAIIGTQNADIVAEAEAEAATTATATTTTTTTDTVTPATASIPPSTSSPTPSSSEATSPTPPSPTPQSTLPLPEPTYANPFLPTKNHITGKYWGPRYGLRQQADLVKLAIAHDVVDLLPYTKKKPEVKLARKMEVAAGLARGVKGTGAGDRVKGKGWERTMKGRLEKRRVAMEGMDALIQEWKQKGHGRGWKKWPSGKSGK
ncbi:hypothetical protein K491DRAFT_690209 [Lophiostoma macrostomum CBS 122681]|uniref:Large ribosomal subunit protein mL59 domain-containing protein n=1 Tax=Lophiostoma macrostomum CBS 122681 TaxID=1314788 RepID=A0A6A6TE17_9PLEO|nr:hypothetical protein K491DRAFT_690209 [Lophiostoma macrostomum CBS 122681]